MAQAPSKTITVDGQSYPLDTLSPLARQQVVNLQVADQEIARLKSLLALAQTARIAYGNALKAELGQVSA